MRKILIIGSAIAAALLLGSGAFAESRVVESRTLENLSYTYVQAIESETPFVAATRQDEYVSTLMAVLREEHDLIHRERMCNQERTETAMTAPSSVTILLNRASFAYIDPLMDPGNPGHTQEKMSDDLRLS